MKFKQASIIYYVLIPLVIILFVILLLTSKSKPQPQPTPQQQPIIIVKTESGSAMPGSNQNIPPHYPRDQPVYNSATYQQIGILTSEEGDKEPIILPLFGRKIPNRSDRWQYYTATDKNTMMRIPLSYQNRDCEDEVGCAELYTGDQLQVSIYQDRAFTVTIYKTYAPSYFSSPY